MIVKKENDLYALYADEQVKLLGDFATVKIMQGCVREYLDSDEQKEAMAAIELYLAANACQCFDDNGNPLNKCDECPR